MNFNLPYGDVSHWELNEVGESNQLYYICNLIERVYSIKTLLEPAKPIQNVLQDYQLSIFKGLKFYTKDFLSYCNKLGTNDQ